MIESKTNPEKTGPPGTPPAQKQPDRRHPWIWIVVVLIVAGIAVLAYFRRQKPKAPPPPPITVSTTNAWRGDINVTVTALGTVTPVYAANMSPRVDGQIVAVRYTEGQLVKSNDLLVEIDPTPYQALETQAEGQLARDQAMLEVAKIDLKRYIEAYEKKAVPEMQVTDQEWLVRQNEGTVLYDRGQVSNAQVQVNYAFIRAPFNGRVGLRLVDPGNIVHAANSNAVAVVTQLQPITVLFNVAEDYLPQINHQVQSGCAMAVEAYDRAEENKLAAGKFLTTDNQIDTTTGTIRIRAVFPNDDLTLFPNQFVNAKLIIDTLREQTLIPTAAIQRNPQGAFVYVITNSPASTNVTMRNVTVGISDLNVTSVEGLQPGETIATDNFNRLGEGTKVATRERNGQSPDGAPKRRHQQSTGG